MDDEDGGGEAAFPRRELMSKGNFGLRGLLPENDSDDDPVK